MKHPTVAVVGLGLIGGSLARALTRAGHRVIGVDRTPVLRRARAARAVVSVATRPEDVLEAADVVVLAAPPRVNVALLRRLSGVKTDAILTDVGSVKGPICREARALGLPNFVGGHPMAGNEGNGFAASSADLFRGRPWILTPLRGSPRALRVLRRLVQAVGARPVILAPAEHDRTVAFLSHVPQLTSWALLDAARGDEVVARRLRLAGPGFRDMTRLAASPRGLWRQILAQNEREVRRALDALLAELGGRRR